MNVNSAYIGFRSAWKNVKEEFTSSEPWKKFKEKVTSPPFLGDSRLDLVLKEIIMHGGKAFFTPLDIDTKGKPFLGDSVVDNYLRVKVPQIKTKIQTMWADFKSNSRETVVVVGKAVLTGGIGFAAGYASFKTFASAT